MFKSDAALRPRFRFDTCPKYRTNATLVEGSDALVRTTLGAYTAATNHSPGRGSAHGIFGPPDFEQPKRDGDTPRLIHWALFDRHPGLGRAALKVLLGDVCAVVEHLYETAMWAEQHSVGRRERLPFRGARLIEEAVQVLTRIGGAAVSPLVTSIVRYDEYGRPDEDARALYHLVVFDILEKIGQPAEAGLRELAADPRRDVRALACEALENLDARGLLDR